MRRTTVLLAVVSSMALVGCADDSAPEASDPTLPSTTANSSSPMTSSAAAEVNERGNRPKALGEESGFLDAAGNDIVTFTVDEIVVDIPCTADYAQRAENGHLVGLRMRVATGGNLAALGTPPMFLMSESDFRIIGPDGITHSAVSTAASYSCLTPKERLPETGMGPSQQFVGTLVLDSPTPTGTVLYAPPYTDNGWEWRF